MHKISRIIRVMGLDLEVINEISNFVNCRNDLNPFKIHASISSNYYNLARDAYKRIMNESTLEIFGYSSSSMRTHYLYKGDDNTLYVIHKEYGIFNDAFYLTEGDLSDWFDGFENEMPEFKLSEKAITYLHSLEE